MGSSIKNVLKVTFWPLPSPRRPQLTRHISLKLKVYGFADSQIGLLTSVAVTRLTSTGGMLTVPLLTAGHFDHKTLRHRDTSAPQYWCRSLRRIIGGAVSHRNCPGSKCPGFSSITALLSKCLVPRFWCRSVLRSVPKCPRVSWCRSVLWPKYPVT